MKFKFFYSTLFLFLFNSCKDPYSIKTAETIGNLVLDGNINDGPGPYSLSLRLTSGALDRTTPLTGASIDIVDQLGNHEKYVEVGKGKYQLNGMVVKGLRGGTYMLDIVVPDGRHYESTQETMPLLQSKDSVSFEVVTINRVSSEGVPIGNLVVNVFLNSLLPQTNGSAYFRWTVDDVYRLYPTCFPSPFHTCPEPCYITAAISNSNLEIVNTSDYSERLLENILLVTRDVDYTFQSKHYFNVNQYALNKNAFTYWQKVHELVARTGSIFDTPPANLTGNVYNVANPDEKVFGYFEASRLFTTHLGVARGYIPGDLFDPCLWTGTNSRSGDYPKYCLNCLSADQSTNTQPSWFE